MAGLISSLYKIGNIVTVIISPFYIKLSPSFHHSLKTLPVSHLTWSDSKSKSFSLLPCFSLTNSLALSYPLFLIKLFLTILQELPNISFDPMSDQNHLRCCPVSSHKQPMHCPNHGASHTKSLGFAMIKHNTDINQCPFYTLQSLFISIIKMRMARPTFIHTFIHVLMW